MKTLGVCGDSFYAAISKDINNTDNGSEQHFTEILAKRLGWDIVTFARGACSNQTIRLQIEEMIKIKPDLVIVGTTSPDRFEFPINNLKTNDYIGKYSDEIFKKSYNQSVGLYNIYYHDFPDKSAENPGFSHHKPTMISETLNNLFNNTTITPILEKNDIRILEEWFDRFYDLKWKQQTDTWLISDGLRKLQENNIKFYCVSNHLLVEQLEYCKDNIINNDSELNPTMYCKNVKTPYRFHTSLESQRILADLWYNKIVNLYEK